MNFSNVQCFMSCGGFALNFYHSLSWGDFRGWIQITIAVRGLNGGISLSWYLGNGNGSMVNCWTRNCYLFRSRYIELVTYFMCSISDVFMIISYVLLHLWCILSVHRLRLCSMGFTCYSFRKVWFVGLIFLISAV